MERQKFEEALQVDEAIYNLEYKRSKLTEAKERVCKDPDPCSEISYCMKMRYEFADLQDIIFDTIRAEFLRIADEQIVLANDQIAELERKFKSI